MDNNIFINIAYDAAIKKYLLFRRKQDSSLASSFLVYTVCMLIYIYGEADIINPYINKSSKALLNNLTKYNVDYQVISKFFQDLTGYYELDNYNKIENKTINAYFTYVQEDLILMFLAKFRALNLDSSKLNEFRQLLFTSDSNNKFRNSINDKYAVDKNGAVNYFDAKIYQLNNHIEYLPIKKNVLPIDIYETFGLTSTDLEVINQEALNDINNNIYAYFKVNPIEINATEKLTNQVNNLKKQKFRLVTNSGKTNIMIFLVFFSIIIFIGIIVGIRLLR